MFPDWLSAGVRYALLLAPFLLCRAGWAQAVPAASTPIAPIGAEESQPAEDQPVSPPREAVYLPSSAEAPSLPGTPQLLNYSFGVMQVADTNPYTVGDRSGMTSATVFSGTTSLDRRWGRSGIRFNYTGAEALLLGNQIDTRFFSTHQLGALSTISFNRWSLLLSDSFMYLPESAFGLGPYGGFGGSAFGNSGLRGGLLSNDSILNGRNNRINNTSLGEIQYRLSPRTTVTASAGYAMLRFLDSDLLNNSQWNFETGINRRMSPRDTLSISYNHSRLMARGGEFHTHAVLLGYSRQLSGRMVFQISGGPLLGTALQGSSRSVSWTVRSSLLYRLGRNQLSVIYDADIAGGSGIYTATRNHIAVASLDRRLSRYWSSSFNLGYARNTAIDFNTGTIQSQFAGVALGRSLGRRTDLSVNYTFRHQSFGNVCVGVATCAIPTGWQQSIGIGLNWHFRPVRIG